MVLNGAGLDVPSTRRIPSFSDLSTAAGGAGADLPSMASSASTNESRPNHHGYHFDVH